jgi:hypothetical protein
MPPWRSMSEVLNTPYANRARLTALIAAAVLPISGESERSVSAITAANHARRDGPPGGGDEFGQERTGPEHGRAGQRLA